MWQYKKFCCRFFKKINKPFSGLAKRMATVGIIREIWIFLPMQKKKQKNPSHRIYYKSLKFWSKAGLTRIKNSHEMPEGLWKHHHALGKQNKTLLPNSFDPQSTMYVEMVKQAPIVKRSKRKEEIPLLRMFYSSLKVLWCTHTTYNTRILKPGYLRPNNIPSTTLYCCTQEIKTSDFTLFPVLVASSHSQQFFCLKGCSHPCNAMFENGESWRKFIPIQLLNEGETIGSNWSCT